VQFTSVPVTNATHLPPRRLFSIFLSCFVLLFPLFLTFCYFNFHSFSITLLLCSSLFAVAWFTFDPVLSGGAGSGLIFSKNNATVSVEGWEHRVALGSVGFSRGVHYWEFTIDNYTADTDPAFGVARIDVARNKMLGKYKNQLARSRVRDLGVGKKTCSHWVTVGI